MGNRRDTSKRVRAAPPRSPDYFMLSSRPLHALVFLLPLIVAYEIGSLIYLTSDEPGVRTTIEAQKLLSEFFGAFGVAGLFVPGIAIVAVLLAQHVLARDPWRVRAPVLAGMTVESVAWTLPLLVLATISGRVAAVAMARAADAHAGSPPGDILELAWQARLMISIGAGLYEEMLFRFVGVAALHFVFADLLRVSHARAGVLAVLGSALVFALYHDTSLPGGGTDWARLIFFFLAGVYLGAVYLLRGLGITVGTHVIYDVFALVLAGR